VDNIRDFQYRAPRFEADFRFLLLTDHGQLVIYGRCYEISEYGMAAALSEPLEVDTTATLVLTLPGEATEIMIQAVISRRRGCDHALTFISPSHNDRMHLCRYLQQSSRD
jgi:hypothetical protein